MKAEGKIGSGVLSILRNGTQLLGSQWAEAILRLVYAAAITRGLGAEPFGVWSYSIATYTLLLGFVALGFGTLMPMWLGTERHRAGDVVLTGLRFRVASLAAAALVLAAVALVVEQDPRLRLTLLIVLPALVARGLSFFALWSFIGLEQSARPLRITVSLRLAEVAVGVALILAGAGIVTLIALHSLVWIADAALSLRLLARTVSLRGARADAGLNRDLMRKGVPLGLAGGLTQWLTIGPVMLMRGAVQDLALLGQFSLALQVLQMAVASVRPFFMASMPVLARSVAREDGRVALYGHLTALVSAGVFAVAGGVAWWLGPWVVALIFGPEFAVTGRLLAPLMAVGGLTVVALGYIQIMLVRSVYWPDILSGAVASVVLVAAFGVFAGDGDAMGAVGAMALAWAVKAAIVAAVVLVLARRGSTAG